MTCRYYLQTGVEKVTRPITESDTCLLADDCICNLSDIELSLDRKDLSGLVKKLSNSWEFVGNVRDVLVDYYMANILHPKGAILVQYLSNTFVWTDLWECPLDFSSFSYDTYKCSINCLESGVLALIKANKGTDYEYDVDTLKETYTDSESVVHDKVLYYDGVMNKKEYDSFVSGEEVEGAVDDRTRIYMDDPNTGAFFTATTIPLYKDESMFSQAIYLQDVAVKHYESNSSLNAAIEDLMDDDEAFHIEALKDADVILDFSSKATFYAYRDYPSHQPSTVLYYAVKKADGTHQTPVEFVTITVSGSTSSATTVHLSAGDKIAIFGRYAQGYDSQEVWVKSSSNASIAWGERATPTNFKVIKPLTLLQKLVDSMCGASVADVRIASQPDNETTLANTLILPAESVRNLDTQKIKTKFNDFCDFMETVFGYVYRVIPIGEDTETTNTKPIVEFLSRDTLFEKNYVSNRLQATVLTLIAEPQFAVDSSKLYSALSIGYDKQDYDEDNAGRYEFNATNKYSTGVTLTDSTLELICPYRADSYGLEELVIKTSTTKSTDSDDDIFIIHSAEDSANNRYVLHRSSGSGMDTISGTYHPASCYNIKFAPINCIYNNRNYIAMTTDHLYFASMDTPALGVDGVNAIKIGGIPINTDITSYFVDTYQLFKPATIDIKTSNLTIPSNVNQPVVFNWNEKNYYCYISSLDIKVDREEAASYKLLYYKHVNLPLWTDDAEENRDNYEEQEDPQINWGDFSDDYSDDYNNG